MDATSQTIYDFIKRRAEGSPDGWAKLSIDEISRDTNLKRSAVDCRIQKLLKHNMINRENRNSSNFDRTFSFSVKSK